VSERVRLSDRAAELAANLADVRRRIDLACAAAGRDPSEVGLVAVSKTFPAADVIALASSGQTVMGEARHQEAQPKAAEVARAGIEVRWHFLGQLQRNKAAAVAAYATCVESVDRVDLVAALARGAVGRGAPLDVLVQVDLEQPLNPSRGGAAADGLVLRGVMAVAPRFAQPGPAFGRLREVSESVQREHPGAAVISAGMSGDLEAAIGAGSTLVRVGTALFGHRAVALG
jgi:hypothetical protein